MGGALWKAAMKLRGQVCGGESPCPWVMRYLLGSFGLSIPEGERLFGTFSIDLTQLITAPFNSTLRASATQPLTNQNVYDVLPGPYYGGDGLGLYPAQTNAVFDGDFESLLKVSQNFAAFDGTVLVALQEAETALSNYARALERRRILVAAVEAAERAARIVRAQNREGLVNSLDTLDAERTLAEASAALADQDAAVSQGQIAVFRALGGGWQQGTGGANGEE